MVTGGAHQCHLKAPACLALPLAPEALLHWHRRRPRSPFPAGKNPVFLCFLDVLSGYPREGQHPPRRVRGTSAALALTRLSHWVTRGTCHMTVAPAPLGLCLVAFDICSNTLNTKYHSSSVFFSLSFLTHRLEIVIKYNFQIKKQYCTAPLPHPPMQPQPINRDSVQSPSPLTPQPQQTADPALACTEQLSLPSPVDA